MFYSIKEPAQGEITEKKSKFICNIFPVESVEEAEDKIIELRKKYHDARHNCFAYKIYRENVERYSDDGEPSGTAGLPMITILNGKEISNVVAIVTRYFGGILLGTGGLVRAYSEALNKAVNNAEIVKKELGLEAEFEIGYDELEELKYHLKNMNIQITNIEYLERIKVVVLGSKDEIKKIGKGISDRINIKNYKELDEKYYTCS